jgi:hypothetical protein
MHYARDVSSREDDRETNDDGRKGRRENGTKGEASHTSLAERTLGSGMPDNEQKKIEDEKL